MPQGVRNSPFSNAVDYVKDSATQVVLGDFTDKVTVGGTVGQVALGLTGIDAAGDVRDILAAVKDKNLLGVLINAAALLPVVGAFKYGDEAAQLFKGARKNADEVGDVVLRRAAR